MEENPGGEEVFTSVECCGCSTSESMNSKGDVMSLSTAISVE